MAISQREQEVASCLLWHIHISCLRRRRFTSEALLRLLYGWGFERGGDSVAMLMSGLLTVVSDAVVVKQAVGAVILGALGYRLWRRGSVSFPVTAEGD